MMGNMIVVVEMSAPYIVVYSLVCQEMAIA
jgi:hypothetical protein